MRFDNGDVELFLRHLSQLSVMNQADPDYGCADCDELSQYLYELIDDAVSETEAGRLARHISDCPECGDTIAAEMAVRKIIRRCYSEQAPAQLRVRITTMMTHYALEVKGENNVEAS